MVEARGKAPHMRSPPETAELMKRLFKMPYEILANDDEAAEQSSLFKLIIIGDSAVGKSCLM